VYPAGDSYFLADMPWQVGGENTRDHHSLLERAF
jgi:hypothetical protein